MSIMHVKIEVGQVWLYSVENDEEHTITEVKYGTAWYRTSKGETGLFCLVDEDGFTTEKFNEGWRLKPSDKPDIPVSKECPCGIFRGDCEYHR